MLRKWITFFAVCLLLSQLYAQSNTNQVAVLNLEGVGISLNESITLTDRLRSELVKSGSFTVVERSEMDEILKEQGFQQSGCTSDECAVEIGKMLNIGRICAGSVGKVGALYTVSLRMIDVETGEILINVTEDCRCPIEQVLTESMQQIAAKLIAASRSYVITGQGGAGKGDIYLKSNPAAAQIYVDGKLQKESTPATIRNLGSGEHLVKVVKGDFVGSKMVGVLANDIVETEIVLGKARGGLKVYSNPAEADIYLDGQIQGKTPKVIRDLPAGDYVLSIQRPGYLEARRNIHVDPETFNDVELSLVKPAALYVTSEPSGAKVLLRGQEMGTTPLRLENLYPERVMTEIVHPGHKTERTYLTLQEAYTTQQSFTLKKLPAVRISSTPDGARVYINDNFRGMTPLRLNDLSDEKIRVTIRKQYFQDWQQDLTLVAGNDKEVSAVLQNEVGRIEIGSSPSGMAVSLDGKYIGTTPLNRKIAYGEYDIILSGSRYESVNEKVVIDQPVVKRQLTMIFQTGLLQIKDISTGAIIEIDGKPADENGTYRLPVGSHPVTISRSGYEDISAKVNMQPGQTVTLNGRLSAKGTAGALWRSMLLPGWGQSYQEKGWQKWLYPVLFFGGAGGSYWGVQNYNDAVKSYNDIRQRYKDAYTASTIADLKSEMDTAWEDVESAEQLRNSMFIFTGAVWLINVLDTMILPPGWTRNVSIQAGREKETITVGLSIRF